MRRFEISNGSRIPRVAATVAAGVLLSLLAVAQPSSAAPVKDRSGFGKAGRARVLGTSTGLSTLSPSACVPSAINCGSTVAGALSTDDCPYGDGSFYDQWTFDAVAGQTVQISMSAGFDTVLELHNASGAQVAFNDDISETNFNSRITYNVTVTGTYTIWANSYDEAVTGAYSLDLQCSNVGPPPTCTSNETTLCLNGGRFRVSVIFSAPNLGIMDAPAHAVPLTSDTGYFWFFSSNNVELVTKVVDGRAFNQRYWVFYGALSDVQYTITVTDTVTGAVKTYSNPPGHLASVADTAAFPGGAPGTAEATSAVPSAEGSMSDFVRDRSLEVATLLTNSASAVCLPDATTLCLNAGRFQVRVLFNAPTLGIVNGSAQAVPLTSDTGYLWFFSSNNVELVIKVVDGRAFNQYFWVFYGALSDVEYTITVTDSETGAVKTYHNIPGTLASVADVAAFR
jgi:pre-peptidase